jgi:multimeric flavodoxin WrbA
VIRLFNFIYTEKGFAMKVCIIHGSPRKGNTYKATLLFIKELREHDSIELSEFYLHKDMPYFCNGCFTCVDKGEQDCPHSNNVQPILAKMIESDGIIFTSPTYALAESAQIKSLLDHLSYIFISHRPIKEMFSKVAYIITTTAGSGTVRVISTIARSLRYWGILRIQKRGLSLMSKTWDDMKLKKQEKFKSILKRDAKKYYRTCINRHKISPKIFTKLIYNLMKAMISGYSDDHTDKKYWLENGWINGKCSPFQ